MQRIGVILAAGRGRRFGGTKQLALWDCADGPKPLVAAAYDSIRPVCDDMIVVLDHETDVVAAALENRPFHRVDSDPDGPMVESIRAGLKEAQKIDSRASVILQPGDHPAVSPSTLERLMGMLYESTHAVIPEYQGRGGHPILIPAAIIDMIIRFQMTTVGLNTFWNPSTCLRIKVDDPSILRDIDTPGDLL
jgi:molybdenum cofactor cytidylyltransferase